MYKGDTVKGTVRFFFFLTDLDKVIQKLVWMNKVPKQHRQL